MNSNIWLFLENPFKKIHVWLRSEKNSRYSHEYLRTFMISRWIIRTETFQTIVVEKIKNILYLITFPEVVKIMRQYGKTNYSWTGHRWPYGRCLCALNNLGYRHWVCINYYFSSAQIVTRKHSNVALYVQCLSYSKVNVMAVDSSKSNVKKLLTTRPF